MDIKRYLDLIAHIDLFRNLEKDNLLELFSFNKYHISKYSKGEVIHFQNEICNTMDIILTGQALVQKIDENGNILTISTFPSGEIIGANLLFSSKNHYPMTAISKVNSTLLHIHRDLVLELCQKDMHFLTSLITTISDKTLTLTDKINTIALKTIKQRIIDFLIYEYHTQKNFKIKLNMSKKEMAERFGIQRPSLSRELNNMRKEGLLDYDANAITILDMEIIHPSLQKSK